MGVQSKLSTRTAPAAIEGSIVVDQLPLVSGIALFQGRIGGIRGALDMIEGDGSAASMSAIKSWQLAPSTTLRCIITVLAA